MLKLKLIFSYGLYSLLADVHKIDIKTSKYQTLKNLLYVWLMKSFLQSLIIYMHIFYLVSRKNFWLQVLLKPKISRNQKRLQKICGKCFQLIHLSHAVNDNYLNTFFSSSHMFLTSVSVFKLSDLEPNRHLPSQS